MLNHFKSHLKNLVMLVFLFWQKKYRQVANKPTEVHLSVTEDCCLQCKMCNIWQLKEKQEALTLDRAKKIIQRLNSWLGHYNLTFAGGEPFLNQEFIAIIKYAHQFKINTSTNSNAYVINPDLAKKIANSGLNKIFFSLDGLEKEHDYVRGKKNSYQRVINAIDMLLEHPQRPQIFINTVISKNNLHQLRAMVNLAKVKKIAGINFQILMPNFASTYQKDWYKNNSLWPRNKKMIERAIGELEKLKKEFGSFILNPSLDIKNFYQYLIDPKKFQTTEACFVGLNNIMIDATGNARLCYEMPTIGNLLKENPAKFWQGKKAMAVRKTIATCQRPCKLLPCNDLNILHWFKNVFKRND